MSGPIVEIELDPGGYAPRPDLFARNLTRNTITFNLGRVKWQLGPAGNVDDDGVLPWTVARSPGFQRVWDAGEVIVAYDPAFDYTITELPLLSGAAPFRPYVYTQSTPQAVTTIVHNHNRNGPVQVALFSLDGGTEYYNFTTEMVDTDTCRIATDDPMTFVATVF